MPIVKILLILKDFFKIAYVFICAYLLILVRR